MAKKTPPETLLDDDELEGGDSADIEDLADIDDDIGPDDLDAEDLEDDLDVVIGDDIEDEEDAEDDDGGGEDDEDAEALDELESEELEMLTDDEASEVIAVDEATELRNLRREQRSLEVDPERAGEDEFVCQSCFLVKRVSQLADRRKRYCRDCV